MEMQDILSRWLVNSAVLLLFMVNESRLNAVSVLIVGKKKQRIKKLKKRRTISRETPLIINIQQAKI